MNVYEPVDYWGKAAPHRAALAFPGGSISYRQLCHAADAAAVAISRAGFRPREMINVAVVNPVFQLVVMLALGRLNIPSAFLKSAAVGASLGLKITGSISEDPNVRRDPLRSLVVDHNWFVTKLDATNPPQPERAMTAPDDLVRAVITSGTTGAVKALELTHGNFEARLRAATLHPDSGRTLSMLPPSSSWGYLIALKVLRSGGTFCFAPFPDDCLSLCDSFQIDAICASVAQAATLVEEQKKLPRELCSVQRIFIGGSLASPSLMSDIQRHVCRNIDVGYGATETGQSASGPLSSLGDLPDAVGYLHPGARVEIVDENDRPLPPGRSGLVRVTGPGSANGYASAEAAGESAFRNGWFYSGDTGSLMKDGRLLIEGRTSDLVINKGGYKASPSMIEDAIRKDAQVSDVAVVAGASAEGAPEIWAAVVPLGSFDPVALKSLFENKLGAAAPDRFFQIDAIPRNDIGKVQYKLVREKLSGARA